MRTRAFGGVLRLAAAVSACAGSAALALPPGFNDTLVLSGWNQAVGVRFAADGTAFVWEKGGRVWSVRNGVRSDHPVIDISEEVGDFRDLGFLGFALDPAFAQNGRVYMLYTVDYHHLRYFGTPQYDPQANQYFWDTITRLTRYEVEEHHGEFHVVPGSRTVLIGQGMTDGLPSCHQSHGPGTLVFGEDGTLLITHGDGAAFETLDVGGTRPGSSNTALADGIIRPKEDVGAFRSQLVDSHNGKILRVDPQTGLGVPSNPFYDPLAPEAPRSRVWGLGLRNPFRAALRPGTGDPDPSAARPGTLFIGDVGWGNWEELSVCDAPGLNFGWPIYEGLGTQGGYFGNAPFNQDTPNPLAGGTCGAFFRFRDLLVQRRQTAPWFPNPCNLNVLIPASTPKFVHTLPAIDWGHAGPARSWVFVNNWPTPVTLGDPQSPVSGPSFSGSSSSGGSFHGGASWPEPFRSAYYHADFVGGWIRRVDLDSAGRVASIQPFHDDAGAVVSVAYSGADQSLYYVKYNEVGESELRRISYGIDAPPVVSASSSVGYGPLPLSVSFSSAGSLDPEGFPLRYEWDFGDGSPISEEANPTHVYAGVPGSGPARYDVTLTVTDLGGQSRSATLLVSGNNTPPAVAITSPAAGFRYDPQATFVQAMQAAISDAEHTPAELTCVWNAILHHNDHSHPEPTVNACEGSVLITPHGDECASYWWEFVVRVTDAHGLSSEVRREMRPICCPADINNDGTADLVDFFAFFESWDVSGAAADVNGDGSTDLADFFAFFDSYDVGC